MKTLNLSVDTYGTAIIHGDSGRDTLVMLLQTAIDHKRNELGLLAGGIGYEEFKVTAEEQIEQWEDGIYQLDRHYLITHTEGTATTGEKQW